MIKSYFFERKAKQLIEHRAACVTACNFFIKSCTSLGVEAVIFGSLVTPGKIFRDNSDVDLCILSPVSQEVFSEIENIAIDIFDTQNISFDLWQYQDLKEAVKLNVDRHGVKSAK